MDRLDDDRAVYRLESARLVEVERHERRRHEARIIEHHDLFGRVAHLDRIVDDQRAVHDPFEQVRRGDIAEVERRILAHQHDVDVLAEIDHLFVAEAEVIARDALDGDGMRAGGQRVALPGQVADVVVPQPGPAFLRR